MEIKKWWWIVWVCFSLSVGCTSHSIPSEVEVTSVSDTKVNIGLVEKDGVIVNTTIPTITTTTTIE